MSDFNILGVLSSDGTFTAPDNYDFAVTSASKVLVMADRYVTANKEVSYA